MARTDMEQLVFTMSADIRSLKTSLDRAVRETGDASGKIQRKLDDAANDNWSKKLGRSMNDVFGEGRQRAIDAGTARMGLFGSAMGSLGPAGMVAAAGVAAFAVGIIQARKAMDMADEVADAATQIGIGTTALQEYRFAARMAGADIEDADKALKSFTIALGSARNGMQKPLKAFKALFGEDFDITQFATVEEALDATADKIAALDNEADRQAFAKKLGLEPLIPLLRDGADGIDALREKAHEFGIVMDEDVIKKAGDAKDKLETMQQVIDQQLAVAFADLAPFIADAAAALAEFLKQLPGAITQASQFMAIMNAYKQGFSGSGWLSLDGGVIGGVRAAYAEAKRIEEQNRGVAPHMTPDGMMDAVPPGRTPPVKPPGGLGKGNGGGKSRKAAKAKGREVSFYGWDPVSVKPSDVVDMANRMWSDPAEPIDIRGPLSTALEEASQMFQDRTDEMKDSLAQGIAGGLRAGFEGGLPGVLRYFADALQTKLFDRLADDLAEALTSKASTNSIVKFFASVFGGPRAVGGGVQRGKVYEVGEHGKELFAPGMNGQIIPNNVVRQIAGGGGLKGTMGMTVSPVYAPVYNITGSGPELDRLRMEMAQDRAAFRANTVGVVNDALQRRQIRVN